MDRVDISQITMAPWEPRPTAELSPNHPAMRELIDSIVAQGVIQPVALWCPPERTDETTPYVCIAGNRRVIAASCAIVRTGITTIPAVIFRDIDETRARAITRAENEIRLGVSPLMDAVLVGQLLDAGNTLTEIAAILGSNIATIHRRAKLLALTDEAREFLNKCPNRVDIRAMEVLASFKPEIQHEVCSTLSSWITDDEYHITVAAVMNIVRSHTCAIDPSSWVFGGPNGAARLSRCMSCANNTSCQMSLPGMEDESKEAICQDCECWKKTSNDAKAELRIEAIKDSGGDDADIDRAIELAYYDFDRDKALKNRKSKRNCVARVTWCTWSNPPKWEVRWGEDPTVIAKREERQARKAEQSAEEAENRKRQEFRNALMDATIAVMSRLDDNAFTGPARTAHCYEMLKDCPADDLAHMLSELITVACKDDDWTKYVPFAKRAAKSLGDALGVDEAGMSALEKYNLW